MFREPPAVSRQVLITGIVMIVAALFCAGGLTIWLVLETRKEQQAIADVLREGSGDVIRDIGSLPGELRWQLVFSILVLIVLIAVSVAVVRLFLALLRSEDSLREVQVRSWNILASMDHGVITTDCEGRITSANPRGQELLGIGPELSGRLLREVCPKTMALNEVSRTVLESGQPLHDQEYELTISRRRHLFHVDCHLLNDVQDQVLGTVIHVRDVTARALMEERMRRMERFMGLGNLAAGLHHEIKNPLSALSIHIQLLDEHFDGDTDDEVVENLAVLKTEVTRIGGVLESFRDYASAARLSLGDVSLPEVIDQTIRLVRPKAEQQNVQVVREETPKAIPHVSADAAKIEQVLLNLMLNSLDAMPDGGKVAIRLIRTGSAVTIEVADSGTGVPENIRSQLFDPYFTTKSDGSGMGLALCDKIAQQHGGQITFTSGPEGTVFRFSLPTETSK
jgi:PAS domain S-box-containing protein